MAITCNASVTSDGHISIHDFLVKMLFDVQQLPRLPRHATSLQYFQISIKGRPQKTKINDNKRFFMYHELIRSALNEAGDTLAKFINDSANIDAIQRSAILLADTFKAGGKVISCGNGGSHCDAMHFAEELTGRFRENRPGYPAIAVSDVSHLSCVGNDFGYDYVFSRYVEALGREGDVLLGISTSGNSENIIQAITASRAKSMKVITMTGKDGGKMAGSADLEIRVPHFGYSDRIQEVHIKATHILIQLIEKEMLKA